MSVADLGSGKLTAPPYGEPLSEREHKHDEAHKWV